MSYIKVRNVTRSVDLGQKVRVSTSFVDRVTGLLLTPALKTGEGLWITPCTSIHTFFMRYPIDALFVGDDGAVLSQDTFRPWRVSGWHSKSHGVLELPQGVLKSSGTQVGDHLTFEEMK